MDSSCRHPGRSPFFRFESQDPSGDAWAEKGMYDACKPPPNDEKPRPAWVKKLQIDTYIYKWYKNNEPMTNHKNFPIRLFVIYVSNKDISKMALISLGEHIASIITNEPKYGTSVSVPEGDEYFWSRDATWGELIGTQAALQHLKYQTASFVKGYYQQYTDAIHRHFRPGTFSVELACILHAPMKEILPRALHDVSSGKVIGNCATCNNFIKAESDAEDSSGTGIIDLRAHF